MGSKHQRFYKQRGGGGFRRNNFSVAGIEEDYNRYEPLSRGSSSRTDNRYRFQRGRGAGRQFQRSGTFQHNNNAPQSSNQRYTTPPWSRITIINGKLLGHQVLLNELSNYAKDDLNPVLFKYTENDNAEFLIESSDVAQALQSASRRISAPNGKKLVISMSKVRAPVVSLQATDINALKKLLDRRYDPLNNAMDLSSVGDDAVLKQEHGNFLPLSRNNVMLTISTLIGQACPNLNSVDISQNKLRFLDFVTNLALRCPQVTRLDLSQNYIENILELEKLWPWKSSVVDLNLELNPLCKRFRDSSAYITAVRRLFPKLAKLDSVDLPPAFKTGIEEELSVRSSLPPIKPSFYVSDQFKAICDRFVTEFFTIFDDPNRQKREQLFQAYDDDAVFSLSVHNLTEEANRIKSDCWHDLVRDSHNIKFVKLWERHRSKLVHKGRLSIVSYFVKDFPAVVHDRSCFVSDISFATDSLICLNVSGIHQLASSTPQSVGSMRFFTRIFLLVPKNDGLAIINEQLFCTTITSGQESAFRRNYDDTFSSGATAAAMPLADPSFSAANLALAQQQQQPSTSGLAAVFAGPGAGSGPGPAPAQTVPANNNVNGGGGLPPIIDETTKRNLMVAEFSKQSGMKQNWAEKCLEDCDWDFDRAAFTFSEMRKLNAVPPDAFDK